MESKGGRMFLVLVISTFIIKGSIGMSAAVTTQFEEAKSTSVVVPSAATPAINQTDFVSTVTFLPANNSTPVKETKSAVDVAATPTVALSADKETHYPKTVAPSSAVSSLFITAVEVSRALSYSVAVSTAHVTSSVLPQTSKMPERDSWTIFVDLNIVQASAVTPKLLMSSVGNQYSVARVSSYAVSRSKLLLTGIPVSTRSIQVLSPSNLLKPSLSSTILPVSSTSVNPAKGTSTDSQSSGNTMGIALAVCIGLVFLISILLVTCLRRRTETERSSVTNNDPEQQNVGIDLVSFRPRASSDIMVERIEAEMLKETAVYNDTM